MKTAIQMAIELLRAKSKNLMVRTIEQRKVKGAYVDAICMLKELLPTEKEQICAAYEQGSEDGFNDYERERDDYYQETYKS